MEQELIKHTTPNFTTNFNDEQLNNAVNYMRIAQNEYQEPPGQGTSDTFNPLGTGGANPSGSAARERRNSSEGGFGSGSQPSLQ